MIIVPARSLTNNKTATNRSVTMKKIVCLLLLVVLGVISLVTIDLLLGVDFNGTSGFAQCFHNLGFFLWGALASSLLLSFKREKKEN